MSQLGQFAQLSYLYNNLGSGNQNAQSGAFENFKNDKSLIKQLQSNMNVSNMPPDFMQQLSHFGFNLTAKDRDKKTNLELDELSTENRNILKESSMFKASTNLKDRVPSTELSFKGRSSDELTSAMMPQSSPDMNSNQESKYSKLMSKL